MEVCKIASFFIVALIMMSYTTHAIPTEDQKHAPAAASQSETPAKPITSSLLAGVAAPAHPATVAAPDHAAGHAHPAGKLGNVVVVPDNCPEGQKIQENRCRDVIEDH